MTFLTPLGALVALAVGLPLAAGLVAAHRAAVVRRLLRLRAPERRFDALLPALAAVPLMLGLAATQPAIKSKRTHRVRTDAQAVFVVDVTRSMLAAGGPRERTRLARARDDAVRLRAAIPDVPAGVSSLTDRVLPHLFPTADRAPFTDTVRRALAIERPPPQRLALVATSFGALSSLGSHGFFDPNARRWIVVLLTDGESRPFAPNAVARSLRAGRGTSLVVVRLWHADEHVYGTDGRVEAAYRPDPRSLDMVERLADATGGRVFDEDALGEAARAIRADAGSGPTARRGTETRTTTLAPYVALSALAPLGLALLRRRL